MRVLVFAPFYLPGYKGGGPIRTIANMVQALGDSIAFSLVTSDRDLGDDSPYQGIQTGAWTQQGSAEVMYLAPKEMLSSMQKIIRTYAGDIIYLNSFFNFKFSIFPLIIWKICQEGKPAILSPRGEFSPGALAIKSPKKKTYIALAKLFGIYDKVIWHASSEHEEKDIKAIFGQNVTVRIALNISKPSTLTPIPERKPNAPLRLVFISRISPKKNLLLAIELLYSIKDPVVFDVYGPNEDSRYWASCLDAASKLPSNVEFNYHGILHPDVVIATLSNYDLFFFPTLGENFGHVISEAISAGLPVLISDQTPWRQLQKDGLGWDIDLNRPAQFVAAIQDCIKKSPPDYLEWRHTIQKWALENIGNSGVVNKNRQIFTAIE